MIDAINLLDNQEWNFGRYMYYVVNPNTENVIYQTMDKDEAFDMAKKLSIYGLVEYEVYQQELNTPIMIDGGYYDDDNNDDW